MIRDIYKPAQYFERYLAQQQQRIDRFTRKLAELNEKGQEDKVRQCHGFLADFYYDMIYAQYSAGQDICSIRDTFTQYLTHVKGKGSMTYEAAIQALSWSILFDMECKEDLKSVEYPHDPFVDALMQYAEKKTIDAPVEEDLLKFPQVTGAFARCLNGEMSTEELSEYIDVFWYHDNKTAAWYEADKNAADTYCGYWCFVGAAVVKILEYSAEKFSDIRFFPGDFF